MTRFTQGLQAFKDQLVLGALGAIAVLVCYVAAYAGY